MTKINMFGELKETVEQLLANIENASFRNVIVKSTVNGELAAYEVVIDVSDNVAVMLGNKYGDTVQIKVARVDEKGLSVIAALDVTPGESEPEFGYSGLKWDLLKFPKTASEELAYELIKAVTTRSKRLALIEGMLN